MVTSRKYVGSLLLGLILSVLPAPGQNVVLVVIDGVRYSESFGRRDTYIPHLWNDLRPLGTIWLDYRNEGVTSTIPGHTSIETGTWQTIKNDGTERATRPTIFEYFRKHTGAPESLACLVVRKEKLLSLSYGADEEYGEAYGARAYVERSDTAVLARVLRVLANERPRLLLINLGETDLNAHAGDWTAYLNALRTADSLTFCLWTALQSSPIYRNNTVLIVTNDHGRHDDDNGGFQRHGDDCEGCQHVMLLAAGGRFSKGYASTTRVMQIDLAGTVGGILGFPATYSSGGSILGDTVKAP